MHLKELLLGIGILGGYFLVSCLIVLFLRKFFRLKGEALRKTLHLIVAFSVLIFVYAFSVWWLSALSAIIMIAIEFPGLIIAKRIPFLKDMFVERKDGEIKYSLALAFLSFFILILVCWGGFNQKYVIITSVLAWGIGDAAAALIGKLFGKHIISGELIEGKKSAEGTAAMFVLSAAVVFSTLLVFGGVPFPAAIIAALIAGGANAIVELTTKYGLDTVSCPLIVAASLLAVLTLFP